MMFFVCALGVLIIDENSGYTHLNDSLAIPKSANIKLESAPIRTLDLILIRYSEEFQLMMDLACAAVAVFVITSLYYYAYPSAVVSEYNLSSVWMIILLGHTIKVLGSLTRVYFSEVLSHERSIGIVFTMMFFVCALGVLIIDENSGWRRAIKTSTNVSLNCLKHTFVILRTLDYFPCGLLK